MNRLCKLILGILTFCLINIQSKGQKVIAINDCNAILLEEDEVRFFQKINDSQAFEIIYDMEIAEYYDQNTKQIKWFEFDFEIDTNLLPIKELITANNKWINLQDIVSESPQSLMKRCQNKVWESKEEEDEPIQQFFMINKSKFILQNYEEEEIENTKKLAINRNKTIWKRKEIDFYDFIIVNVSPDKNVILLYEDGFAGYVISTHNNWLVNVNNEFENEIQERKKSDKKWMKDGLDYMHYTNLRNMNHHYTIDSSEKGFQIIDMLDQNVLNGYYDTIKLFDYCIITERNNVIEVWDNFLQPVKLPNNTRAVHPHYDYLQILANNSVSYIETSGKKTNNHKVRIPRFLCGNVEKVGYEITQQGDTFLIQFEGDSGGERNMLRKLLLLNINPKNTQLQFLNRTKMLESDYNDLYLSNSYLPMNWLLIKQNDKWGIVSFDEKWFQNLQDKDVIAGMSQSTIDSFNREGILFLEEFEPVSYRDAYDTLTQVLPLTFDNIKIPKKWFYNEPFKIYKNNLVGYFPISNTAKYKRLYNRKVHFERFQLPNGKKGWLDLKTGIEYFDK